MKHILQKDDAVSPVIGVMLMLVVTIIIAAVVSSFAGGLAGDTQKAPQASLVAKEVVVNEAYDVVKTNGNGGANFDPNPVPGKAADIYVIFEHKGGDGINLHDIEVHLGSLKYPSEKSMISNAKEPNANKTFVGEKVNIAGFSKDWKQYLQGFPDRESLISPGSQFALHADYAREGIETRGGTHDNELESFRKISWRPDGASNSFDIGVGDYLTYDIIDKKSRKSISSGQILVPDFQVRNS